MYSPTHTNVSVFFTSTFVFVLTTAITFGVYVSATSKSIPGGDSGELVAEGKDSIAIYVLLDTDTANNSPMIQNKAWPNSFSAN